MNRKGQRRKLWTSSCLVLVTLLTAMVQGTTVVPPSFEQLVGEAEVVFEGEVIDTKARLSREPEGETIFTDVYFRVRKVLKGTVGSVTVLEFLGGTVGDRTFSVDGMPSFSIGDRDVIFASPSLRLVSPLVGMMHGRVRITTDQATNQDLVRRFDGSLIRGVGVFESSEHQPLLSSTPAMSLSAFEAAVVARAARTKVRAQ